jgi:hypothetical protein
MLIEKSDLIVVGKVASVGKDPSGEHSIATLTDLIHLTGPELTMVEVNYQPDMICPAPAQYKTGTDVVAFLTIVDEQVFTTGLVYGAKTLPEEERKVYVQRIREFLAIDEADDGKRNVNQVANWV